MNTINKTIEEIRALPQNIRLAGYLLRNAKLTKFLSELRLRKCDEEWTTAEELEWEYLTDELDPWWYALSDEESSFLRPIEVRMAALSNGESIKDNPFIAHIGSGI